MDKDRYLELLADMLFAYENKDEDCPHNFEVIAVKNSVNLLLKEYTGTKYSPKFFTGCLERMNEKSAPTP